MTSATVVGVAGGSGGVGVSTFAAALAVRATAAGRRAVAVDADPRGGGWDVTFGLECEPGLRWHDLRDLRGAVVVDDLVRQLPQARGVPVLSFGRLLAPAPPPPVLDAVAEALHASGPLVVVDLGRADGPVADAFRTRADAIVLVVGNGVHDLAAGQLAAERLAVRATAGWLVVRCARRSGGWDSDEGLAMLAEALDLPLVGAFGDDVAVETDLLHGIPPGERERCALTRTADQVLAQLSVDGRLPEAS